jgi:hypothetical protein
MIYLYEIYLCITPNTTFNCYSYHDCELILNNLERKINFLHQKTIDLVITQKQKKTYMHRNILLLDWILMDYSLIEYSYRGR